MLDEESRMKTISAGTEVHRRLSENLYNAMSAVNLNNVFSIYFGFLKYLSPKM